MYVNHVSKERTSREPFLIVERDEDTPCNDIQGIEDIRKLMVFLTNFLEFLITTVLAKAKKVGLKPSCMCGKSTRVSLVCTNRSTCVALSFGA